MIILDNYDDEMRKAENTLAEQQEYNRPATPAK